MNKHNKHIMRINFWFNKVVAGVVNALPCLFTVATAGYLFEFHVLKWFGWDIHMLWIYVIGIIFFCSRIASIKTKISTHDEDKIFKTRSGRFTRALYWMSSFAFLLLMSTEVFSDLMGHKGIRADFVCQMVFIWSFCAWMYYGNLLLLKITHDD